MPNRERERRKVRSARERAEKHTSGFDSTSIKIPEGVKLFKLEPGVMYIDIIPYVVGEGNPYADSGELHYERTFHVHRGVGPGGDSYICLKKTAGKPCPICEYRHKLSKDPDADEDTVKEMGSRERQLFNVINVKDRDAGIQLWDISYHLFGKLLDARVASDEDGEGWDMFHDPEKGLTLKLTVTEKTFNKNTFPEVTAIDFKTRKEQYEDKIVDEAHCLDELLKIMSYDKLKAVLLQTDEKEEEEEDEPVTPKKKSKPVDEDDEDEKPAKKSSKNLEEPEEDDDDEKPAKKPSRVADEDEDEKPAKKPVKRSAALEDDDDEDEKPAKKRAVDEDEEEDEKPAKSSKKSVKDEDEEEDESDEDDEDEKPVKKVSKSKEVEDDDGDNWDDDDEKPAKKPSRR